MTIFDYHGMKVNLNDRNQFVNLSSDKNLYHQWGRWWIKEIEYENSIIDPSILESDVKVAVIDSGINMNLPQFAGQIIHPLDTVSDINSNLSDQFRYKRNEDIDDIDDIPEDFEGHGTAVSSIICSSTEFVGINPKIKLVPIRSLYRLQDVVTGNYASWSKLENIILGIEHAINVGVDIINMSMGGEYTKENADKLHLVIKKAFDAGICLFGATGNDNGTNPSYPASYPEVLAVSASDIRGKRWHKSNFGDNYNNFVSAPGSGILGLHKNGNWYQLEGTSMATPIVSGIASLIIGHLKSKGYHYTPDLIYQIIRDSCVYRNTNAQNLGAGIVNLKLSLETAKALTLGT